MSAALGVREPQGKGKASTQATPLCACTSAGKELAQSVVVMLALGVTKALSQVVVPSEALPQALDVAERDTSEAAAERGRGAAAGAHSGVVRGRDAGSAAEHASCKLKRREAG